MNTALKQVERPGRHGDMRMHLLLVEDDEDHARIILRSLKTEECVAKVDHVQTGMEALAYLRKEGAYANAQRPDLILLDLKLPQLDGHSVLAEIKRDPNLRDIPVVILTTSDADQDMAKAYQHYANSYLVKPLDASVFRKMIEDLRRYWGKWNRSPAVRREE